MTRVNARPKHIFFLYRFSEKLPAFVLLHRQQQVKSWSEYFEVVVNQMTEQKQDYVVEQMETVVAAARPVGALA